MCQYGNYVILEHLHFPQMAMICKEITKIDILSLIFYQNLKCFESLRRPKSRINSIFLSVKCILFSVAVVVIRFFYHDELNPGAKYLR